ncbi:MAG: hypothetical protein LBU55_01275 [Elusimicrobiota bacterium]|jgi:hypothetical protein|nr:hypothetical protein [Elusimicrobiota bacterium]
MHDCLAAITNGIVERGYSITEVRDVVKEMSEETVAYNIGLPDFLKLLLKNRNIYKRNLAHQKEIVQEQLRKERDEAIEKKISENGFNFDCLFCFDEGVIKATMRGRDYTLRCKCEHGDKHHEIYVKWNGEKTQQHQDSTIVIDNKYDLFLEFLPKYESEFREKVHSHKDIVSFAREKGWHV